MGMKVIIAGSRGFRDYSLLRQYCNTVLQGIEVDSIVSGMAYGADTLGIKYAMEMGYKVDEFPARWDVEGLGAGYARNKRMARYADILIAFWDGQSRGTKHMCHTALEMGLTVHCCRYLDEKWRMLVA